MPYTPPNTDNVNFELVGAYTAPANNAINFELEVQAQDYDLDCPAFELQSSLSVSAVLWYREFESLNLSSAINISGISFNISVPPFIVTSSFTANAVPRLKCQTFNMISKIDIANIVEVPEGYDVVAPWPFESSLELTPPDIAHLLTAPPFELDSSFDNPVIFLDGIAIVTVSEFSQQSELSAGVGHVITCPAFESSAELSVLAIILMPEGDQYLACPKLIATASLTTPEIVEAVIVSTFEMTAELSVDTIFAGIVIDCETFVVTSTLSAVPYPVVILTPFVANSSLSVDIQNQLAVQSFEATGVLNAEFYDGDTITAENFNLTSTLNSLINLFIPVPAFNANTALSVSTIAEFIAPPAFSINSVLSVSDIKLFTLDNAQIFYYFVITGDADGLDDIEIKFTSIQTRKRNGQPTYLNVSIFGIDYAEEIVARSNGTMQVYMGYVIDENTSYRKLIVETNIENVNVYEGAESESIVMIGYKTVTYPGKTITMEKPIYTAMVGGRKTYRFAVPRNDLEPGDTVQVRNDSIVVDNVTIYIRNTKTGPYCLTEIADAEV